MPFADFCDVVRVNHFTLRHDSVTRHRSPEVSSTAFDTQPPDLPPVSLMDMGFAILCSLARPRFFQAPPRGECYFTLALRYDFTSIRFSKGLSPSSCRNMLGTHKKPFQTAGRVCKWHEAVSRG
jgi:hypothetical protein